MVFFDATFYNGFLTSTLLLDGGRDNSSSDDGVSSIIGSPYYGAFKMKCVSSYSRHIHVGLDDVFHWVVVKAH